MPLNLQGKVLRALETKTIQRLGSTRSKKVDFRLLTASNEDLYHLVEEKKFRADLYYRLAVIPIRLPPLRERREDIIPLAQHFLKLFCRKYAKDKEFSPQTLQLMIQYPWPGNVRELRNFVERAVVMSLGRQVAVPDVSSFLDPAPASPLPERPGEDSASVYSPAVSARYEQMISSGVSLQQYLDQCGRNYVAYALQKYGNSYKAAEAWAPVRRLSCAANKNFICRFERLVFSADFFSNLSRIRFLINRIRLFIRFRFNNFAS